MTDRAIVGTECRSVEFMHNEGITTDGYDSIVVFVMQEMG
jgi:hypothetical protein